MVSVRRIVLDVLKPHRPNGLEFARAIAGGGGACTVRYAVSEVDEQTETVVITIEGENVDFDALSERIAAMGGSIHSVDEVEVSSSG